LKGVLLLLGATMAKEVIRQNIVRHDGIRTYEIDGMRVTMPESWDDDKKQAWLEKARVDMHLRRNLKMIRKDGSQAVLGRAFRQHGDDNAE